MENRQRLRPWLEAKINSGTIPGLQWLDPAKTTFSIPWKHGGKQDWTPENSQIFKDWAIHTGRFREGVDEPDYATWKTRLRCAFNKAPDIEEVKLYSNLDSSEPHRVYKFLPRREKMDTSGSGTLNNTEISMDCDSKPPALIPLERPVITTLMDTGGSSRPGSRGSLPSDLKDLPSNDLIFMSGSLTEYERSLDYDKNAFDNQLQNFDLSMSLNNPEPTSGFNLTLYYRSMHIYDCNVPDETPCHIHNNSAWQANNPAHFNPQDVYVEFPPCVTLIKSEKQRLYTDKLLESLDYGLDLYSDNFGIWAFRKCKCAIFYSSPQKPDPVKIERNSRVCLFDFQLFQSQLTNYCGVQGSKPIYQFSLSFGQQWRSFAEKRDDFLITADVISYFAKHRLTNGFA